MSGYPKDTLQKLISIIGILGPIIHVIILIILDATWVEYNPFHQFMSELGATNLEFGSVLQFCGYLPLGITWMLLTIGLYRGVNRRYTITFSTYFFTIASISLILLSFFPCDPGCQAISFSGHVHELLGIIENVSFILGMYTIVYPMRRDPNFPGIWWKITLILAMLASTFMIILAITMTLPFAGLIQRLTFSFLLIWTFLISIRLYQLTNEKDLQIKTNFYKT